MLDATASPHGDARVLRAVAQAIRDATESASAEQAVSRAIHSIAASLELPRIDAWSLDGERVIHLVHTPDSVGVEPLDVAEPSALAFILAPFYVTDLTGANEELHSLAPLLEAYGGSGVGVYPMLSSQGHVLASITAIHHEGDDALREGFALLSQQLGCHLERMINDDAVHSARRQLAQAQRLTRQLTTASSSAALFEQLVDGGFRLFDCTYAEIHVRAIDPGPADDAWSVMTRGSRHGGNASCTMTQLMLSNPGIQASTSDGVSTTTVPVVVRGTVQAVLYLEQVSHGLDAYNELDRHDLLQGIAEHASLALASIMAAEALERSYEATIKSLASALEASDRYTHEHSSDVAALTTEVGRRLGMSPDELRDLELGALLHDIGKLAIPSEILNKPGKLTDEEFEVMKSHTIIGERIIAPLDFLASVAPIVRHEHERWDGAGYPDGIAGTDIPLASRIIFVCDAYDAITTDRPYRKARSHDVARAILEENAGSQFDPAVVQVFLDVMEQHHEGRQSFAVDAAAAGETTGAEQEAA